MIPQVIERMAKAGYEKMVGFYFAENPNASHELSSWDEQSELCKNEWREVANVMFAQINSKDI